MGTTYTRQSSFSDGDTITAALFNDEFNQLLTAFSYASSSTTGHQHDGTAAEGGNIHTIGDQDFLNKIVADSTNNRWGVFVEVSSAAVEQIRISDGVISPVTDNDIDLGTSSLEFKDLFLDGTAHVDTLDVDVNATVAGTLGVTGAATLSSTLNLTSHLYIPDSAMIQIGGGTDLRLYHDGGDSYITNSTGALKLATETSGIAVTIGHTTSETTIADNLTVTGNATIGGNFDVTGTIDFSDSAITNAGDIQLDSITGDGDTDTAITFSGSNVITVKAANADQVTFTDGAIVPSSDNDIDLGTSSTEFKDAYFDGTVTTDALVADTADINGGSVDGATLGTNSAITQAVIDNVNINGTTIGHTDDTDLITLADGVVTVAGELDATTLDISGNADIDGTANLDNTDIDGTLAVDGATISLDATTSLNIDNSNTSNGITIGTATSGVPISIGHSTSEVTVNDNLTVTGTLTLGSGAELAEAELEMLDGITAGTVAASKAVVVDSNKDAASFRNITLTGELDAATLDISGDADIDGTLEADAYTVDGTSLAEFIADTAGAMVSSNTESGVTVTYQDGDNTIDFSVDAAQTGITSIYATDLILGEDAQTAIDFGTANEIDFKADNAARLTLTSGALYPVTDNEIDLGTSSLEFKDAFFDGTVTSDAFAGPLTGDVTGTSSKVTVSDSTANTNFPVVFHDESNALLDDTGALRYNPSTGELLVPKLTVAGTTTTADTVTMQAANAVIFEGATADAHETTLSIVDPTGDHTQYLINQGGYIPVLAAATTTAITSTPAELNLLDGSTANTVVNSKAVIYGSSGEIKASSIDSDGGITVDNITIDGTEIDLSSGDLTLDVAGRIVLSADDNGEIRLQDGSSIYGQFKDDSDRLRIESLISDADMLFVGNDGGSEVTALTLDMSAAGAATFNNKVTATELDISGDIDIDGTTNLDVVDIDGAVDMASTLGVTGVVTANAGVVVDNITIDGTEIDLSSGDLTLDVAGDIILDADGGDIKFHDAGTHWASLYTNGTHTYLQNMISDGDIYLTVNDGGSSVNALIIDGSEAGAATFNNKVTATELDISGNIDVDGTANLDAVDIDGAVQIDSTLSVGVDGTGHDVKFFGDTASAYMLWDQSTDDLILGGAAQLGIGTTTPAKPLQVKTTADGTLVRLSRSGVCDWDISIGNTSTLSGVGSGALEFLPQNSGTPNEFAIGKAGTTASLFHATINGTTMSQQPAFCCRPASTQSNMAADGVTVVFGTEVFDVGANFASNTFTAPVTGKYFLNFSLRLDQVPTDATYIEVKIVTSNNTFHWLFDPDGFDSSPAYMNANNSVLCDMDASDTAYIVFNQSGGTAQVDCATESHFSGNLAC